MTFAQQARLAVGAAVAEGRKHQRDRSETIEMRHEILETAVVRPDHPELAGTAQQRLGIGEKAFGRDQHRAVTRQFGTVGDTHERIGRDSSLLNEWHRRAP